MALFCIKCQAPPPSQTSKYQTRQAAWQRCCYTHLFECKGWHTKEDPSFLLSSPCLLQLLRLLGIPCYNNLLKVLAPFLSFSSTENPKLLFKGLLCLFPSRRFPSLARLNCLQLLWNLLIQLLFESHAYSYYFEIGKGCRSGCDILKSCMHFYSLMNPTNLAGLAETYLESAVAKDGDILYLHFTLAIWDQRQSHSKHTSIPSDYNKK